MAELRIPIIVENKGKKAFKEVDNSLKGLTSSFKKLAGAAGIGLSALAVINFGKNGVKAFAENEKSAKRLAGVVRNLGQAFETPFIEANLDRISAKFGYQGEVLRDAYQKLITATGSAAKSNELLTLSLDVAAGSSVDLVTVNQDLAAAYLGNNKGLSKYGLGLSKAQIKTLKFEDAVTLLGKSFKGAAGDELETYEGKMRVLGESADSAQEIIGGSLVDAFMILAGDTTTKDLSESMASLATNTANVITQLAKLGKAVADFGAESYGRVDNTANRITDFLDRITGNSARITARNTQRNTVRMGGYPSSALGPMPADPNIAKRDAIEKERLKREKERLALEKKAALEAKKRAALEKAARTLELERINLTAGLKGKISEADRLSLQLQLALLDKNDAQATKLAAELDAAVKRNNELAAALLATPKAPNPYADWKAPDMGSFGGGININDMSDYIKLNPFGPQGGLNAGVVAGVNPAPTVSVTVQLDSQAVGDAVRDVQINESLSGSFSQVNRRGRFAENAIL